jgi:hypothetical protein
VDIEDRARQFVVKLVAACSADEQGRTRVDTNLVLAEVRRDPEAVTFAAQRILASGRANSAGWSMWMVTARVFEEEYEDDSLVVLVESAAAAAGETLPGVVSSSPVRLEEQNKLIILEMAEADLVAGDAHRILMDMRLESMSADLRSKLIGNCIIAFPALGDERPVQHIPRIRAFVADLHRRMPSFPLFLDFHPQLSMRMVYFGCLANIEATMVRPDGLISTDLAHPAVLAATREALVGVHRACTLFNIDWKPHLEAILAPYDLELREKLLGELDA